MKRCKIKAFIGALVIKRLSLATLAFICSMSLAGCRTAGEDQAVTPSPVAAATAATLPTATEVPLPSLVYIDRLTGWKDVSLEIDAHLMALADSRGWRYQSYDQLPESGELSEPYLIVLAGGPNDYAAFVQSQPQALFILIAVEGAKPEERIAVVGPEGMRPDQAAFIAGYLAAMVTPDWRIGVVGVEQSGPGRAAISGVLNGVKFFCGLCRPAYPPFHAYPASAIVAEADGSSLLFGYEQLTEQAVKTIVLLHEFSPEVVAETLRGIPTGLVRWIGPKQPEGSEWASWLATISPDPTKELDQLLARLEAGETGIILPMSFTLRDVNEELLTAGKLQALAAMMRDLELGIIDTGVNPATGEVR